LIPLDIEKSVILLGAGASSPAGVPMACGMTDRMLGMFGNDAWQTHYFQTARTIIGALQMASGVRSNRSGSAIDIEHVLNAAKLLGTRFDSELSPFVGAWHQILEKLERTYITIGKRLPANAGAEMAPRLSQGPDGELFRNLVKALTEQLIRLSWLTDHAKTAYLDPLLKRAQTTRLIIATLNYDNTVELAAHALGIPCDTLGEWQVTRILPEPTKGIDLLKLHGSIDWRWSDAPRVSAGITQHRTIRQVSSDDMPGQISNSKLYKNSFHIADELGILFGGGNKLTAEGPFMDLLYKFKRLLWERQHLVVIGYSFRDEHINHVIDHWFTTKPNAQMTIVEASTAAIKTHPFCLSHEDEIDKRLFYDGSGVEEALH
jgi:hypothetical protein